MNTLGQIGASVAPAVTGFLLQLTNNGWNFTFILQNDNTHAGYEGPEFASGASCEAGFYQDDGTDPTPDNLFAIDFDSSWTSGPSGNPFT